MLSPSRSLRLGVIVRYAILVLVGSPGSSEKEYLALIG